MPLYDYHCHKCGETFEVRQKFSEDPLVIHEACGGELERLLSVPALQFKGTGWYVTDYGKGGKSPSASADGKSDGKPGAKPESASESKSKPSAGTGESKPAPSAPASK